MNYGHLFLRGNRASNEQILGQNERKLSISLNPEKLIQFCQLHQKVQKVFTRSIKLAVLYYICLGMQKILKCCVHVSGQ